MFTQIKWFLCDLFGLIPSAKTVAKLVDSSGVAEKLQKGVAKCLRPRVNWVIRKCILSGRKNASVYAEYFHESVGVENVLKGIDIIKHELRASGYENVLSGLQYRNGGCTYKIEITFDIP
jgi:hypothetical protein